VAAEAISSGAISHRHICTSGKPDKRKLIHKDVSARTVPRTSDFLRNCRMEKRRSTELYSTAAQVEPGNQKQSPQILVQSGGLKKILATADDALRILSVWRWNVCKPMAADLGRLGAALQTNWQYSKTLRIDAGKIRCSCALVWLVVALLCVRTARAQVVFEGSQISLAGGTWSAPFGVTVDGNGNLFVADRANNRIVELTASGSGFNSPVTVLSGLSLPAGIAADWNGNIFLSDTGNNRILMLPITSTGLGAAVTIASGLNTPIGLAVDSAEDIFVADSGNNRIVELPSVGGTYGEPVVVGTGLNNPMGVAVDVARNLWIADTGNKRVVKELYNAGGYSTQQLYWTGLTTPSSIAVDKNYNLYVADNSTRTLVEAPWFAGAGRFNSSIEIGSGFADITGVAVDGTGNVYVSDSSVDQVFELVTGSTNFGSVNIGSPVPDLIYNFSVSAGTTVGSVSILTNGVGGKEFIDAGGSTCLAQTYTSASVCGVNVKFAPLASGTRAGAVELFGANGNPLATAFISGVGNWPQVAIIPGTVTTLGTQLSAPSGVVVDGTGNVYIADTGNNRVVELPWTGNGYGPQVTLPVSGLVSPMGMVMDAAGNLFIASNGNNKLVKLPVTKSGFGAPASLGEGLNGPTELAADTNGDVFLTDTLSGEVGKFTWTGSSYSAPTSLANFHQSPMGIAADSAGNVFFSDPYQSNVTELPWSGTIYLPRVTVESGAGTFPSALATDGNRNLYILDSNNNRVTMLPWTGSGFGKQIVVASGFNAPSGMALAGNTQLFIADTGNNQVVKIDLSLPGALNFENTYLGSTSADSARIALVENVGNQSLTLSSVAYPEDFPEAQAVSPCTENLSLAQGTSCELAVEFTPMVAATQLAEAVNITDDSLDVGESQQSIPVTGTSLNKLTQTISFPSISGVVYGTAPMPLTATSSSGLPVSFAVVSGPGTLRGQTLRFTGAGTVVVEATQVGSNAYRQAPTVEISVNVAPAILTVTPVSTTALYGSIPALFGYTITEAANGEGPGTAYTGRPAISSTANSKSCAGSYILTASQGTLSTANYTFVFATSTLTVTKAWVRITAASFSRTYGTPMSTFVWSMSGFLNGDTAGVVTGAPVLISAANSGSPVGSYPIQVSAGTLVAANYQFQGVNGTITVTPALLTVTGANQAITYGGAIPVLSYWISGFMNGDTSDCVSGAPSISTSAVAQSGAGTYPIVTSLGTLAAANYTFRFVVGTLSIGKAFILVQPGNASMIYGAALPVLPYTLSGFVNGDTVSATTGVPKLSTPATSASKPGSYAITAAVGTLASKNYSFTFSSGTLTVGQAVLTVTPKTVSMTYGAALPAFSYQLSGFVNGDNAGVVQGAPVMTSSVTKTSPVGTYSVLIAAGSLSAANYSFNMVNGEITVGKAPLTVTPVNQSMTYGSPSPSLTYTLAGFVNGDSQATAITGAPALTTTAAATSSVGQYTVTAAPGTLAANNYAFEFAAGSIKINKATLTLTAKSLSMTARAAVPPLTYTITGWVNGDAQSSATTGAPALSTSATASATPGTYPIAAAQGNMLAGNYQFIFVKGVLTVTAPPLPAIPRYRMTSSMASRDSE